MLKKIITRKMVITTMTLILIFIIYLIPNPIVKPEEKNKISVEYSSNVSIQEVFMLDSNSYVARTSIPIKTDDAIEEKCKYLLDVLTIGGKKDSLVPNGFTPIIPSGTDVISLEYIDGIVKVNFSSELLSVDASLEEKMIESIIYTLTSVEEVKGVIIFVDGELLTRLPKTKITLPSLLSRDYGINKTYDIQTTKDIDSVVIYYLNKHNDHLYYVPVTSYTNDKREKIKIIIDELTSGPTYESNLMSFVNSNAKLLEYDIVDSDMKLMFNNYILSDVNNKDILEEVIYSIALSIRDNYGVESVSIYVDDEEIVKSVFKNIE